MPTNIEFHWDVEEAPMLEFPGIEGLTRDILKEVKIELDNLALIFVSDPYLKELHAKYLDDDTLTDVMTFDLRDDENQDAEIYISVDRAKIQAAENGVHAKEELLRYIIHGILHLAGYDDRTDEERDKMKVRENELVSRFSQVVE